jgi:hypothetical protein
MLSSYCCSSRGGVQKWNLARNSGRLDDVPGGYPAYEVVVVDRVGAGDGVPSSALARALGQAGPGAALVAFLHGEVANSAADLEAGGIADEAWGQVVVCTRPGDFVPVEHAGVVGVPGRGDAVVACCLVPSADGVCSKVASLDLEGGGCGGGAVDEHVAADLAVGCAHLRLRPVAGFGGHAQSPVLVGQVLGALVLCVPLLRGCALVGSYELSAPFVEVHPLHVAETAADASALESASLEWYTGVLEEGLPQLPEVRLVQVSECHRPEFGVPKLVVDHLAPLTGTGPVGFSDQAGLDRVSLTALTASRCCSRAEWPGVSMRFTWSGPVMKEATAVLIVMPRRRSISLESV